MIRIKQEKLEAINARYDAIRKEKKCGVVVGKMGLNIKESLGVTIFSGNWGICNIEDIDAMIDELTDMRTAIEEETGIYFG